MKGRLVMTDIRERIGYRGLVMFWLGWVFLFIGLTLIPDNPQPQPTLWHTQIGLPTRVILWVIPGVFSLVAGVCNYWTPRLQIIAFPLLIVPPLVRVGSYARAALIEASWARVAGALVYAAIVIGVLLFASWPEPSKPRGLDRQETA